MYVCVCTHAGVCMYVYVRMLVYVCMYLPSCVYVCRDVLFIVRCLSSVVYCFFVVVVIDVVIGTYCCFCCDYCSGTFHIQFLLLLLLLLQKNIPVVWSAATTQCVVAGSSVVCVDVSKSAVFSFNMLDEDKTRETSFQVGGSGGRGRGGVGGEEEGEGGREGEKDGKTEVNRKACVS